MPVKIALILLVLTQSQPDSKATLQRAREYMAAGRFREAVPICEELVKADPGNQEARQVLADLFYDTGHYYLAAVQLLTVTSALPSNTRAWYVLGRTWGQLARDAYEQLLSKAAPDSAYGLAVAADGLMQRHLYRRALLIYNEALAKDPDLVTARASAAEIYRQNGRPDWAAQQEERIARLDCSAHALACESRARRYKDVVAATLNEQTVQALYWRAQAYTGLANEAFGKLAQLPPSLELHRYRAGIAWEAGQHAEMVTELRKALEFAPADREIRRDLAMALGGAGEYDAAYRMARELLQEEPSSPELNNLAGAALLNDQRAEEAIPYLKKALGANPKDVSIDASLGRAYIKTGEPRLALPYLEAAASTDKDGSLHYALARAYRLTGQTELANKAMAEYQKLSAQPKFPPEPPLAPPGY